MSVTVLSRSSSPNPSTIAGALLPDIVRDAKLETQINGDLTIHICHTSNPARRQRPQRVEEVWLRKQVLGKGTFGIVWLETCTSGPNLGELRAVKEIRKEAVARDKSLVLSCARELEAIAKFSHKKYRDWFVESFGWFETASAVCISMEYLALGDLQRYLGQSFPEAEALAVSHQLLEGLSYMHSNGFAHRDLKPANVLVLHRGPSWWVKIADFGISKRVDEATALRTLVGTMEYLAPEVIGIMPADDTNLNKTDGQYTASVDMWALSQITFRMITNQAAFADMRQRSNYVAHGAAFPSKPLTDRGVSDQCCDFIKRMMAPSASQRLTAMDGLLHPWMEKYDDGQEAYGHEYDSDLYSGGKDADTKTSENETWGDLEPIAASGRWTTMPTQPSVPSRSVPVDTTPFSPTPAESTKNIATADETKETTLDEEALLLLLRSHKVRDGRANPKRGLATPARDGLDASPRLHDGAEGDGNENQQGRSPPFSVTSALAPSAINRSYPPAASTAPVVPNRLNRSRDAMASERKESGGPVAANVNKDTSGNPASFSLASPSASSAGRGGVVGLPNMVTAVDGRPGRAEATGRLPATRTYEPETAHIANLAAASASVAAALKSSPPIPPAAGKPKPAPFSGSATSELRNRARSKLENRAVRLSDTEGGFACRMLVVGLDRKEGPEWMCFTADIVASGAAGHTFALRLEPTSGANWAFESIAKHLLEALK